MRDRRPQDWRTDLHGRHTLEDLVAGALANHERLRLTARSTAAYDRLDYQLLGPDGRRLEVELKAKQQRCMGWSRLRPEVAEADLFILDELALRHLVDAGRYGFLLIRDVPCDRWVLWSLAELVVCTKVRLARQLASPGRVKGKVLLDLSEAGASTATLGEALDRLVDVVSHIEDRWRDIAPWPRQSTQRPPGLSQCGKASGAPTAHRPTKPPRSCPPSCGTSSTAARPPRGGRPASGRPSRTWPACGIGPPPFGPVVAGLLWPLRVARMFDHEPRGRIPATDWPSLSPSSRSVVPHGPPPPYLSTGHDPDATTVLDRPHRHRRLPPPPPGMKIRAARQSDIADILALARLVDVSSAEAVTEIARHVFGGEPLSERSRAVLTDLDDALHQH